MRIRAVALSYMAGAGLLVAVASGTLAFHEWGRLSAVREAESLVEVIGAANRFVETMALERGVYNQVIVSAGSQPDAKQRLVTERVKATDAIFDQTFAALATLPAAKGPRFKEPIEEARLLVAKARARGDDAWRSGTVDRALAAQTVLADFVSAGRVLDTAMIRFERAVADINPRLGLMLTASRLSNEMREAAGQRSTILSRYAGTGQKLDPASATKVAELTGSIQGTWERLNRIVRQVENSPKLAAAVDLTRATFMTEGERVYQHMAAAARDGAAPPMEFLQWRAWTVPMLTNILAPRDAPVEQALDDIRGLRSSAQLRLSLVVFGGGFAILLFLGAGMEIERRVIKPLARLTKALDRAAETGPVGAVSADLAQYEVGDDELGALSRALGRFHQSSAELRRLHQRFDAALSNLPQGLCVFDADQRLLVANSRYAEIYGLAPEQVAPGTPLETILKRREAAGSAPEHAADYVRSTLDRANRSHSNQVVTALRNGRMVAVSMQPLPEGGWVATHEDVTARYEAEARIAFMANHDALTELPNRILFHERMTHALSRVQRGETAAVLCLDLDQFKSVNDTLGHPAGDRLLRAVAERLVGCVRTSDTVARLGGDEFAILQVGAGQPDGPSELARRIIAVVSEPYQIDGQEVVIGTSIGVALAPADTMDADELLKSADVALYRAKADGRGRCRFFEREMDARIQARRALEVDLRQALANREFQLYFQHFINIERNEVTGFEALLRWNHPERGMVLPAEFIAVAEEIGLIVPLGEWVLQQACMEAATWPNQLSVAVNLSPAQFKSKALLASVVNALASSGLPPSRLELEITESVLLRDDEANIATLHQLRALGVRISLDDFGTGYSSLRYLRRFPFDKIKIDSSFVRELTSRGDSAAIVRAIASLGRSLGIVTTAEGVETAEQLDQLRAEGCVEAQGYLFSRPKPACEVVAVLEEARRRKEPAALPGATPAPEAEAA